MPTWFVFSLSTAAVAAATSLPELTTYANAILLGSPTLSVGDLFGSCMANMAILAVADLLAPGAHVESGGDQSSASRYARHA